MLDDLPPPNRRVRLTLKLSLAIYPPPKSSSPTYPQIVCTIYPQIVFGDLPPPPKSSSLTYPQIVCTIYSQIVFGDLPLPPNRQVQLTLKSSVQFTLKLSLVIYPPPEIAKSDLSSNCLCQFTPIVKCEVFEYIVLNIKKS